MKPGPEPRRIVPFLAAAALLLPLLLLLLSFAGGRYGFSAVLDSWRDGGDRELFDQWLRHRVARLLFAAGIGGALALAGVAFQAVLRNPLADPYILGISGGASVGVLSAPMWAAAGVAFAPPAFAGAIGALFLLAGAARWAAARDPGTLILTGAVLNAVFGAAILLLFEVSPTTQRSEAVSWVMGDLGPTRYIRADGSTVLGELALALGIGIATLLALARSLDLLALGEEEAADLGIRPAAVRWVALLTGSLVTAVVVALAGPIGFVGLIVPHAVRRLAGAAHRRLIPVAVLAGAAFLMLCDTIARTSIPERAIPVGIVTAFLGAPFFIALLRQRGRDGALA